MSGRLSTYLAMSPEALSAPLWTFPAVDALLIVQARRRVLGGESALLQGADERALEFAETDPE